MTRQIWNYVAVPTDDWQRGGPRVEVFGPYATMAVCKEQMKLIGNGLVFRLHTHNLEEAVRMIERRIKELSQFEE